MPGGPGTDRDRPLSDEPARSAFLQRGLGALSRLGLNVQPWIELQRARINRPVALRLEAEASALRDVLVQQAEILRQQADALAQQNAALTQQNEVLRQHDEALRAQATAWRDALLAQAEAAKRRASAEDERSSGLQRELRALRGELAKLHAATGALTERSTAAEKRLSGLDRQVSAQHPLMRQKARDALALPAIVSAGALPEVSIVMPVRDRANLVAHAIRSVQAQSHVSWELLVVDDGSSDGSADVVAALATSDDRIRLFCEPARGHSAARNVALAAARGSLIAYIDSDNVWFPGFLAGMVEEFRADPSLQSAYGMLFADESLVADRPYLWESFDQAELERTNFIDINTYVHRSELVEQCGGFDEGMSRLVDWELVLRQADHATPRRLPIPAAAYRCRLDDRVTLREPIGPNLFHLRRKRLNPGRGHRAPRVLYAVWHYPQITESYIETELRCMQRLGAEIEVWSQENVASPYAPAARFHRGLLEDAIVKFRPDVVHVHWLGHATLYGPAVAAAGLPMTVRAHGFETSAAGIEAALSLGLITRLYLFPSMTAGAPLDDPRVRVLRAAFDTQLFTPPSAPKDRRLVLRTGAALPSKDYGLFFETAARLQDHRFVLVAGTCLQRENVPAELHALNERMGGHAEIMMDVPREQVASLMGRAGLYLHTALPPGVPDATPIGAPISIAEAMATGAHVLFRNLPPFAEYVGEAGAGYSHAGEAENLIRATTAWDDAKWDSAVRASVDRAWSLHADDTTLAPLYEDWCAIAAAREAGLNSLP
ncbi:glycosyltransferase [Roseococcus sp. YIM B11640]|uniref:glycosyltransferase n=1 Tax=Roseococcus sp. YIM B11640 TaxID=3133973 RepID=UPI003C7D4ED8